MATDLEDLLPLLARLAANRDARISLADLAASAARSPTHFQRTFARLVGESPKQLGRRLQLECAAALLLTTTDTILDVALACGFDSHEGFTRAFAVHFGRSPRDFRARGLDTELAARLRHADLLTHVGPCVRLFRTPLDRPTEPRAMHYDITQQPIPETTALFKRKRVEHAKIAEALGEILPAVFGYATQAGITLLGPPMCRYVQWGPAMVTLEAGLAVAPGSVGKDDIAIAVWPACTAAVTIHTGPYDGLGEAHAALELYLHDNGLVGAEGWCEIYLTDPGEVPDPREWKTQVVWPLAR